MSPRLPGGTVDLGRESGVREAVEFARRGENREAFFDFLDAGAEDCLDDVMADYIRLHRGELARASSGGCAERKGGDDLCILRQRGNRSAI